ncbi:site-specific integrase [bacterium]|nr:site-specific integrase [bacterium]
MIWLHPELADALKRHRPANAAPDERVFDEIPSMDKYKADLQVAGIPYKDGQGRQADLHALRHALGTKLQRDGVTARLAMELMRHSDMRLTAKICTDATQLPTAGVVEGMAGYTRVGPQPGPQEPDAQGRTVSRTGTGKAVGEPGARC